MPTGSVTEWMVAPAWQPAEPRFVALRSPNIVGRTFTKETWRVSIPESKTLADLDWVGIWCVAVGADFGSGPFKAP